MAELDVHGQTHPLPRHSNNAVTPIIAFLSGRTHEVSLPIKQVLLQRFGNGMKARYDKDTQNHLSSLIYLHAAEAYFRPPQIGDNACSVTAD